MKIVAASKSTTLKEAAKRGKLLSGPGNSKLGAAIHSFSMPAIYTCPGATVLCGDKCYGRRSYFIYGSLPVKLRNNYQASLEPDFEDRLNQELIAEDVAVCRIHVVGDFYNRAYLQVWLNVIRAHPDRRFFAYTRSWRIAELLPLLRELATLPNLQLWFSEDRETGRSPYVPGVRVAFMVTCKADEQFIPDYADLVFRDTSHARLYPYAVKRIKNVLVCPHEQGVKRGALGKAPLTCTWCQLCWTAKHLPQKRTSCSALPVLPMCPG